MRRFLSLFLLICGIFWVAPAEAKVQIDIDLSTQTMNVQSSSGSYSWAISSARSGYYTPRGTFTPKSLQAIHYSRKYYDSPMPHSIFFAGGYAIHGTYETGALGRPASHGCVRISPENAALLFEMVKAEGATITIHGNPPETHYYAEARHHHRGTTYAAVPYYYGSAVAYAPSRHWPGSVQQWQYGPFGR